MSFMLGLYPAASSRAKSAVSENRDEGVLVGEQDYRQENRDRIKELRQEFQQRQEAIEAVMEEMRQDIEKRAEEHPYARASETASLGLLIADAIRRLDARSPERSVRRHRCERASGARGRARERRPALPDARRNDLRRGVPWVGGSGAQHAA
jgi:hypothetical protein